MKATIALGVCLLVVVSRDPASTQSPISLPEKPAKLWSEDNAEFRAAELIVMVQQDEAEAIRYLETFRVKPKQPEQNFMPEGATKAIAFLGAIRSVKAASILCDHLIWQRQHDSVVGPRLRYPASAALVQIGTPAVPRLLTQIARGDVDIKYRQVALGVLVDILGKDSVQIAIDNFKITDDDVDKIEGRKRLESFKRDFKTLYAPPSKQL